MAAITEVTTGLSSDPAPLNPKATTTFIHPQSAANLSSWCETPLPVVGSTTVGLRGYTTGADRGASAGTKTQSYTSFASQASSYLVGLSAIYGAIRTPNTSVEPDQREEVPLRIVAPTQEQLTSLSPTDKKAILNGRKVFVNLGYVMTMTQYQNFIDKGMTTAEILRIMQRTTSSTDQAARPTTTQRGTRTTSNTNPQNTSTNTDRQGETPTTSRTHQGAVKKQPAPGHQQPQPERQLNADQNESYSSTTSVLERHDESDDTLEPDGACGPGHVDASVRDDNIVCVPTSMVLTTGFVPGQRAQIATTGAIDQAVKTPFSAIYNIISTNLSSDVETAIRSTVKNPVVRESTTWPQLTTALQHDTGSIIDEAPLVRLALIATSLCRDTHEADITPLTFVRNVKTRYSDCAITSERSHMPDGKVIAMPIDAFLVYCADQALVHNSPPPAFHATLMDVDWCAIPVTSQTLNSTFLVEYVVAHLSSSYTYGTVNVAYYYKTNTTPHIEGYFTTMPSATTSYIPGTDSAILVLLDVTSASCSQNVSVGGVPVPVYNGSARAPGNPANMRDIWHPRYQTSNINSIRSSCFMAWNFINRKQCVLNTAGRAAAELSKITRPGMAVEPRQDRLAYDTDTSLAGGWYLTPDPLASSIPLCRGSKYLVEPAYLPPGAPDIMKDAVIELMEGFNVASYSPFHLPPSSITPTRSLRDGPMAVILASNSPPHHTSTVQYNISQASSIKRLSVAVKLIDRGETPYITGTLSGSKDHMMGSDRESGPSVRVMLGPGREPLGLK